MQDNTFFESATGAKIEKRNWVISVSNTILKLKVFAKEKMTNSYSALNSNEDFGF